MSERHVSDELPLLLTGDANREVVMAAAVHLRTCPDCGQELVSAVVAHASLTSAHRFAPEIVAPAEGDELDAVPDPGPLPDLGHVFAQARQDAAAVSTKPVRHRRRLLSVVAAAAVLVGGGVTVAALEWGTSQSSTRTVQLDAFGVGQHPAKITIDGSKLKIDASRLPKLDSTHIYELWVTDGDRKQMQPVGSFGNGNKAELTLASKVMSQYNDFEVSIQKANQIEYSGVSVLRGQYG